MSNQTRYSYGAGNVPHHLPFEWSSKIMRLEIQKFNRQVNRFPRKTDETPRIVNELTVRSKSILDPSFLGAQSLVSGFVTQLAGKNVTHQSYLDLNLPSLVTLSHRIVQQFKDFLHKVKSVQIRVVFCRKTLQLVFCVSGPRFRFKLSGIGPVSYNYTAEDYTNYIKKVNVFNSSYGIDIIKNNLDFHYNKEDKSDHVKPWNFYLQTSQCLVSHNIHPRLLFNEKWLGIAQILHSYATSYLFE